MRKRFNPGRKVYRRRRPARMRRRGKRAANKITTLRIRGGPKTIISDRSLVKLTYIDTTRSTINNAGGSNANIRYAPTGIFDIDPHIASAAIPGYSEWANFYNYYRVHAFKYRVDFANLETSSVPMTVYCIPVTPTDPGDNVAFATASEYPGNPFFKYKWITSKGGMDRATLTGYVNCKKFVGSKSYDYDDNYSALVSGVPISNIWLVVGATSANTTFTLGLAYQARITCYIEFYGRKRLNT